MKYCLECNALYSSIEDKCPDCELTVQFIDGFPAYAPSCAQEGNGFKSSYFAELASKEAKNFWFRARTQLIVWALGRYSRGFNTFLELGCGTGYVLSGISNKYPNVQLQGSELFIEGLAFAAKRVPSVRLMQMDARKIPFAEEFDVIGAFDVLEHIKEDEKVLKQIFQALKPRGSLILTVPQHSWLWSPVDDHACHVRRYSARELNLKLKNAGFEMIRSTSFVTTLLPAMYASRIIAKLTKTNAQRGAELDISPWLNFIFEKCLRIEAWLIQCGINFPVGGSRLVVARKLAI